MLREGVQYCVISIQPEDNLNAIEFVRFFTEKPLQINLAPVTLTNHIQRLMEIK
jgi:hypothetical protein